MPSVNDDIRRRARVRIGYHDVHGNAQTEESDGLCAVCHQHEIDQLNGPFWIKRLFLDGVRGRPDNRPIERADLPGAFFLRPYDPVGGVVRNTAASCQCP